MTTTDAPFLERDAGSGFVVTLDWEKPEVVTVAVLAGCRRVILDEFEVPTEQGLAALHHTVLFSKPYAEALA